MIFCKHKWVVLVEKTLPAAVELAEVLKQGARCSWELLQKTHIVILACEKCGALDKTKTVDGGGR